MKLGEEGNDWISFSSLWGSWLIHCVFARPIICCKRSMWCSTSWII